VRTFANDPKKGLNDLKEPKNDSGKSDNPLVIHRSRRRSGKGFEEMVRGSCEWTHSHRKIMRLGLYEEREQEREEVAFGASAGSREPEKRNNGATAVILPIGSLKRKGGKRQKEPCDGALKSVKECSEENHQIRTTENQKGGIP